MKRLLIVTVLIMSLAGMAHGATKAKANRWDPHTVLKAYLVAEFPWKEIEVRDVKFEGPMPSGEPEKIFVEQAPPGTTHFLLRYGGGKSVRVTAEVKAFDPVVMSGRSFGRGHVIAREELYSTLMDVSQIPRGAYRDIAPLVGRTLSAPIQSNKPLREDVVDRTSLVKKGKKVVLVIESSGMRVTTSGELRENGNVGGTVRAWNMSSKSNVTGILVDENTVEVSF